MGAAERAAERPEAAAVAPRRVRRERAEQHERGGREPEVEEERREARRQPEQVEERGAAHVCASNHQSPNITRETCSITTHQFMKYHRNP